MKKISILGCGWLGIPLAEKLTNNYNLKGSVRKNINHLKKLNIEPFCIDIEYLNTSDISSFLEVDILIITLPPRADNYISAFNELIKQIEKSTVKKVIYCSSISVYGKQIGSLSETHPTLAKTKNAEKMILIEHTLLKNTHFNSVILRLGGLIGLDRHPAKHLSNKVIKNSTSPINLIHLVDVIGSIEAILQNNLKGIFNIVSPYHPKKIDYYSHICRQLGLKPPKTENQSLLNNSIIDSTKISSFYSFQNEKLSL